MVKNLYFLLIVFACFFCVGCCAFSFAECKLRQSGNIIVKNRLRFGDSKLHETQLSNDETVKIAIRRGYWTSDLYFRFNVNKGCVFLSGENGKLAFLPNQVTIDISHEDDSMLVCNGTFRRHDSIYGIYVQGYKRNFPILSEAKLYLRATDLLFDIKPFQDLRIKNSKIVYYPLLNLKTSIDKKFIYIELPLAASDDFDGGVEIWVSYNWYNDL